MAPASRLFALVASACVAPNVALNFHGEVNGLQFDQQQRYAQEYQRHLASLAAITSNMTMDVALAVLQQKGSKELISIVEDLLQPASRSHLRQRPGRLALQQRQPEAPKVESRGSGLAKALDMLNSMIYETLTNYETEHHACCDYEFAKRAILEELAESIALFNAETAQAEGQILSANAQIRIAQTRLPVLKDELNERDRICRETTTKLNSELKIVLNDIEVITTILTMTDCEANQKQVSLLLCPDDCSKSVTASFGSPSLDRQLAAFQSPLAQRLVQRALTSAAGPSSAQLGADFLQATASDEDEFRFDEFSLHRNATKPTKAPLQELAPRTTTSAPVVFVPDGPCTKPRPTDPKSARCTVTGSNCYKIQERFLYIQSGMMDEKFRLSEDLAETEASCKATRLNLENQIQGDESLLEREQTKLARWITVQNNAREQSRLKMKEKTELEKEFKERTESCHANYVSYENEECGLKKVRGALTLMQSPGAPAYFQDCEVSAWQPKECSVSCGGGLQRLTRTIVTHPEGGVKCLPLSRLQPCNQRQCPIDCSLEDWQPWSGCTAQCGGGLMQRGRVVRIKPRHGGVPCGQLDEARSCNTQACDQDCQLSDWSAWSSCTQICGGGKRHRVRQVQRAARGMGTCPSEFSHTRLHYEPCNWEACPAQLTCTTPVDVVLMLDGSTAVGQAGWTASKAFAQDVLAALFPMERNTTRAAVMSYSGPLTWGRVNKCSGGNAADEKVDLQKDCQMTWATHFTADGRKIRNAVNALQWPQGGRLTSVAMGMAEAELPLGRRGVPAVVVVLTAGRPLSYEKTAQMSKKIKQSARLIWVAITDAAPTDHIAHWASAPHEENIVAVRSFNELKKSVTRLVSSICPARQQVALKGGHR